MSSWVLGRIMLGAMAFGHGVNSKLSLNVGQSQGFGTMTFQRERFHKKFYLAYAATAKQVAVLVTAAFSSTPLAGN